MKEIRFPKGKVVCTPWLRPDEAAAYCGVSRAFFDRHGQGLPHGGNARTRLYRISTLDAWVNNELDVPFAAPPKDQRKKRKKIIRTRSESADGILVNPLNGRVFHVSS